MFLVGIFQWWYGPGLSGRVRQAGLGVLRTADFFSVGLLARTLFNPFRQISAGTVQGPLPVQLRAAFDRLFSRAVGFVVRSLMIAVGLVSIILRSIWELGRIAAWLLLPVAPLIGVVLWQLGVGG